MTETQVLDRSLRVLMLGWEYPPVLAGGLGVACQGLVEALSEFVHLDLILPQYSDTYINERLRILGLTDREAGLTRERRESETRHSTFWLDTELDLDPYPVGIAFEVSVSEPGERTLTEREEPLFEGSDPYGPEIMRKAARYRNMVLDLAEGMEFDLIHAHDWATIPAAVSLADRTGKPLVLHIHSLETDRVGEQRDFSANAVYEIERRGMERAQVVIPVSAYTKRCAIRNYQADPAKLIPVHNAISPLPDGAKSQHSTQPDAINGKSNKEKDRIKTVVFLGRVTFQKGPEFMIETAVKLLDSYRKVRFIVAGAGDRLDQLKSMVAQRGLGAHFEFPGFLPTGQVRALLASADVYFMPSVSEPFGLSALEAAQHDVPCVVSTQSGVSEVLPNALQADFWDTDRFANYLYALLNYDGLRKQIITGIRQDLEDLTWREASLDVLEIYHHVLGLPSVERASRTGAEHV